MKPTLTAGIFALVSMATPAYGAPAVEVTFVNADRYSDASPHRYLGPDRERDAVLAGLREHLQEIGRKWLVAGDTVKIEIVDVDLAGELRPRSVGGREIRVLSGSAVPRIRLRYSVTRASGRQFAGEELLVGGWQWTPPCLAPQTLCHERLLLSEWFAVRVASR